MGLIDELPTRDRFDEILAGIVGDGSAGTGVAGVLALLESLDPPALSASVALDADAGFSAGVEIDAGATVAGPLAQLEAAVAGFPDDPAGLLAPIAGRLAGFAGVAGGDLTVTLESAIEGLRRLDSLSPADLRPLVAGIAEGIDAVKAELLGGAFAELREWSGVIERITTELQPLLAGGTGTVEDRLIGWLVARLGELVATLLPDDLRITTMAVDPLGAALPQVRLDGLAALRADVLVRFEAARVELAAGNTTNLAALQAAHDAFAALVIELGDLVGGLAGVLDGAALAPEGLLRLLRERLVDLRDAEVVDLGNLRQRFAAAIKALEEKVRAIDLAGPMREVDALFDRIDAALGDLHLDELAGRLSAVTDSVRTSLDGLDASLYEVVATVSNLFAQLRSTLRSVTDALGEFDDDGHFRFHAQDQVGEALLAVRDALEGTVRPLLEELRTSIGGVLAEAQTRLEAVRDQVEGVKDELRASLQGISDRLAEVDVPAEMDHLRSELRRMLDELGRVDFDVVAEPVIGQIDEMRDVLADIDVSAMSELSIGALKVSVEVVVAVDFTGSITSVLMAEIDELLAIPKAGLDDLEAKVEAALAAFATLDPAVILAPLHEVFEPVEALLAMVELGPLVEPIEAWFRDTVGELDRLDPAVLLRPLVDIHGQLAAAVAGLSPLALAAPVQSLLDDVRGQLRGLDLGVVEESLGEAIARVRAFLDKVSPAALIDPLGDLFDKVLEALAGFDPAILLEPFAALFAALTEPLARLTDDHAAAVALAFSPLRLVVELLDPRAAAGLVAEAAGAVRAQLPLLDVGRLIAELQGPFTALQASARASGPGDSEVSVQVEVLNPLHDPVLARAAADLQAVDARLAALASGQVDAELDQLYAEVKPKIEGLVPSWAKPELTPDEVRQAFAQANPFALGAEVRGLWQAFVDQVAGYSPRLVQARLQASYDRVVGTVLGLEPSALLAPVRATLDELAGKLDVIEPAVVLAELTGAADDIAAVVAALDPTPIIDALQAVADEVKATVEALDPAALLADLEGPLEATKDIVRAFDPAALAEPLREVFAQIQGILVQVDVGVVLEPLVGKLDELRADLADALERVEAAFNGMVAAIPVAV